MAIRIKNLVIGILFIAIGFWFSLRIFNYFMHSTPPKFSILGIVDGCSYARDLNCFLKVDNDYKVQKVAVFLDGKLLNQVGQKVSGNSFEIPFSVDTKLLKDGQHTLEAEVVDASFKQNRAFQKFNFYVDNVPLKAVLLETDYNVFQGQTVHLRLQINKQVERAVVKFINGDYICVPESSNSTIYEGFIPIGCEEPIGQYSFSVEIEDAVKNFMKLNGTINIRSFNFPKQKGFYISDKKVNEEKEVSMNTKILEEALEKWLKDSPKKKLWNGCFEIPTEMQRISTPFGEIRVTPQWGKYYHRGIDIVNYPRRVVWASQDGRVIIKDRYVIPGNVVVLDHGVGVFTLYYHLDEFADIEVGDFVKKGNPIGKIGMTGYATGYHLHWDLRVNNVSVDPLQWTKKSFWG